MHDHFSSTTVSHPSGLLTAADLETLMRSSNPVVAAAASRRVADETGSSTTTLGSFGS